jgi:hypothetical protein
MLRVLDSFWPPGVRVTSLKTPFGLLIRLLQSHTRNYSHSQLFFTLSHIYTAYNLTCQCSTLFSRSLHNTLDIFFTNSHFTCLSPIETSLVEPLLKTPLENWLVGLLLTNWLLRHSSSSYIALNHTTAGKSPLYCCANRVMCVANRCGATKYKHFSLLLARLTSALFGFLRLSSARHSGNTISAWCNTSQYIFRTCYPALYWTWWDIKFL